MSKYSAIVRCNSVSIQSRLNRPLKKIGMSSCRSNIRGIWRTTASITVNPAFSFFENPPGLLKGRQVVITVVLGCQT